jgi:DNA-binding NtrC family response regulator
VPGNVRQLYHTLLRAAIWADHETLDEADIQAALLRRASKTDGILGRDVSQGIDINEVLSEVARHYLPRALAITAGNKTRAAELLGLSNYQTLNNWLQRYGIENEE